MNNQYSIINIQSKETLELILDTRSERDIY